MFSKLPGLYQMLPAPERFSTVDLYSTAGWPKQGPQPRPELLRQVARVRRTLAEADERFTLVAGVNQETVTGLSLSGGAEFVYECSRQGDGTVPLDFALLPGARTYTVEEEHGSLPNNGRVCAAVVDLLSTGETSRLDVLRRRIAVPVVSGRVSDGELVQKRAFDGRRGAELSASEVRRVASQFVSPDAREQVSATPVVSTRLGEADAESASNEGSLSGVVIGRRRQRQLQIRLAYGNILGVRARAYVTGIFNGVDPGGPAAAIDAILEGTIEEFTRRRMFTANAGEIFAIPTADHLIHADTVVLAGLGSFDQFGPETQQLVAENVGRSLQLTRIDDFATVLFGVGSGHTVAASLQSYLIGLLRGLSDTEGASLRRVTLCETDRERFKQMRDELLRLTTTKLFDDVQLTLDEIEVPAPPEPVTATRAMLRVEQPVVYLHVRREPGSAKTQAFRSTVLTAGSKAAVITGVREVSDRELSSALSKIDADQLTFRNLEQFGSALGELVLAEEVRTVLDKLRQCHLVVVHDAPASRIPWETLCIKSSERAEPFFPAKGAGLSRRYIADNLSVSKWLEERRQDRVLKVLLVANPTEDLDGANVEAARIKRLFERQRDVSITELAGPEATKPALLSAFRSGQYDVLHYAGHAYFDPKTPSLSGIYCAGEQVLTGAELANLARLPSLVFFNACEAGRIRGRSPKAPDAQGSVRLEKRIEQNVGLAEAFLRGGVPNYVGTYWPVSDRAAEVFAATFYAAIIDGQPIGTALGRSRLAVFELREVDWADYVLYGSFDFVLKRLAHS
ncbi:MAG: CHAT domain-containing protein [Anaeromyxobacter sp.]